MKKSIILLIVIAILLVSFTLALIALYVMTQESRIAEHKIRRIRAVFAARAGMVHALEELRRVGTITGCTNAQLIAGTCSANLNIGDTYEGYPTGGYDPTIQVNLTDLTPDGPNGTFPVDVTITY